MFENMLAQPVDKHDFNKSENLL